MMEHIEPPRERAPRRSRNPPEEDAAFDAWLAPALHALFDNIATAPIPPKLAALLEEARQAKPGKTPCVNGTTKPGDPKPN